MLTAIALIAAGLGCVLASRALVRFADRAADRALEIGIVAIEILMIWRELAGVDELDLDEYGNDEPVIAINMRDGMEHSTCNCHECAPFRTIH